MKNYKIYIIFLFIFFLVFAGTGLFLLMKGVKPSGKAVSTIRQQPAALPTVAPKEGLMQLAIPGNTNRFSKNTPVTLQIIVDSNNENIVGWDAIISYDPAVFDFVQATSAMPDFKIYSFKREKHISLSAIKSLQNNTSSVFKTTVVATVILQPKLTGKYPVILSAEAGKEKTNLVNTVTKRIYPQLNTLSLEIY